MSNVTTTSEVSAGAEVYFDKQLLARARPKLIHNLFGQRKRLPSRTSKTAKFRRQVNLTPNTTPLSEGVTPAGKQLQVIDIQADVSQYGDYITVTDVVQYTVDSPTLNDNAKLLGQQMGESVDQVTMEELEATASVYACEFGDNTNTPTEMTDQDLDIVVETLLNASADMFSPVIPGDNKEGTVPIREAFWAMGHTKLMRDLQSLASFVPTSRYPDQQFKMDAEWGSTDNIRWCLSPLGSIDVSTSPDTYNIFVCGQDAYGVVELEEGIAKHIFKELGSGGTEDPLDQRATQGWKTLHTAILLNQNWIRKVQCTRSTD